MLAINYWEVGFVVNYTISELWTCSGNLMNISCYERMESKQFLAGATADSLIRSAYRIAFTQLMVLLSISVLSYFICAAYYPDPFSWACGKEALEKICYKLFWPVMHFKHNLNSLHTIQSSKYKNDCTNSEEIWITFKTVETGIEASFQLGLQLWLIRPFLSSILEWPYEELFRHTMNGIAYFITFGYVAACSIENALFKILFAIAMLSFSLTKMKCEKPGTAFSWSMLISILTQVVARVFAIGSLFLLTSTGFEKYVIFPLLHATLVFVIKITFDSRCEFKSRGLVRLLTSVFSSWIVLIDLQDKKNKASRLTFLQNAIFFFVVQVENLVLVSLPDLRPDLYPPQNCFEKESFATSRTIVIILGFVGLAMHIIHYKFWHPWANLIEPLNGQLTFWFACKPTKFKIVHFRAPWESSDTE